MKNLTCRCQSEDYRRLKDTFTKLTGNTSSRCWGIWVWTDVVDQLTNTATRKQIKLHFLQYDKNPDQWVTKPANALIQPGVSVIALRSVGEYTNPCGAFWDVNRKYNVTMSSVTQFIFFKTHCTCHFLLIVCERNIPEMWFLLIPSEGSNKCWLSEPQLLRVTTRG